MHRPVKVAHSSFIEGLHNNKNTDSVLGTKVKYGINFTHVRLILTLSLGQLCKSSCVCVLQMSVGPMSVGPMSVGPMSVGQMSLGQMVFD